MHNLVLLSSMMVTRVFAGAMDTLLEGDISVNRFHHIPQVHPPLW